MHAKNLGWRLARISSSVSDRHYFLCLCEELPHCFLLVACELPSFTFFMCPPQPHKGVFSHLARSFYQNVFLESNKLLMEKAQLWIRQFPSPPPTSPFLSISLATVLVQAIFIFSRDLYLVPGYSQLVPAPIHFSIS